MVPVSYLIVSLTCTSITIERENLANNYNEVIYLNTNGIHLDVILPKNSIDSNLLKGIIHAKTDNYLAFGWGDKDFYLKTPTWDDLTFKTVIKALFWKSSTLMHVTRYYQKSSTWVKIAVSTKEIKKLCQYIQSSFKLNDKGMKQILENKGYSIMDNFYQAKGSYSCFKTCNSWVNSGFKESGLKSCLWTPFDFGLLDLYKQ